MLPQQPPPVASSSAAGFDLGSVETGREDTGREDMGRDTPCLADAAWESLTVWRGRTFAVALFSNAERASRLG
jgi:hypothetical protein